MHLGLIFTYFCSIVEKREKKKKIINKSKTSLVFARTIIWGTLKCSPAEAVMLI